MVVAVHLEGVAGKGREEELLYRHLLHLCQLHCHAHGLKTGYSRDVHGDVSHTLSERGWHILSNTMMHMFYFAGDSDLA